MPDSGFCRSLRRPALLHSLWTGGVRAAFVLTILSLIPFNLLAETGFGQNKVQYEYFDWQYLTTEHFNIYYYQDSRDVADYAAEIAEDAYRQLSTRLNYAGDDDKPISLVVYKSHNDFEQTNVTSEPPEESVGGFTEYLKTRVVVPFDGNHEAFRHVIHHELTHAFTLNLLYGQGIGSVLAGISQIRLPLWFTEGLAEYESRGGLDPETEMYLRDAVVNDNLPETAMFEMYGYLGVYKCGQSVLYYLAWRYGDEKITEILHQMKALHDFDRALLTTIGIDEKELSKRWRRFYKERYWPQVAGLDRPDLNAVQLTDHVEERNFINVGPAISPNGEYIAFLTDRSDYFDVYLMRAFDGKIVRRLIRGQRTSQLEELKWLRPGISWSPDGKKVAITAKAGAKDAIHIVDVATGDIDRSISFDSDGLFSPSWSPNGKSICFVYMRNGKSDIALTDPEGASLTLLTDDSFDDADPSWASDGKSILFVSNRSDSLASIDPSSAVRLHREIASLNVFRLDVGSGAISQLTHEAGEIHTPIWTPNPDEFLYSANRNGAFNLYIQNINTGVVQPLSNVVTGFVQPSIATKTRTLAFTAYSDLGFDIYLMNDPFTNSSSTPTRPLPAAPSIASSNDHNVTGSNEAGDYTDFVFDRLLRAESPDTEAVRKDSIDTASRMKPKSGKYASKPYSPSLEPDMFYLSASYSPYFRAQGSGMMLFSDELGNHHAYLSLDLNRSTQNSNIFLMYDYLPRRMDLGIGFYHYAYPFYYNRADWTDEQLGFFAQSSYPLSRYNRFEFGADYLKISRSLIAGSDYSGDQNHLKRYSLMPHVGYVHDTSIWKNAAHPGNGGRWRVDMLWSPNIGFGESGVPFTTFAGDWRRYFPFAQDYSFAFRMSGGASYGAKPQQFFMGGVENWFNPNYDDFEEAIKVERLEDIYYSSFVTPIRGVGYYHQVGNRYLTGNAEFRFPFIRQLLFGWPLPFYFNDVRGTIFTDWGAAWKPDVNSVHDGFLPRKGAFGFGTGIWLNLGIFPLEIDVAWSPDAGEAMVPHYYFSINQGF